MRFAHKYLGFTLSVFLLLIGIVIGYEVVYEDKDSMVQTIASVFRWFGPILEVQVTLVIIWEGIIMVMADYSLKEQNTKRKAGLNGLKKYKNGR